MKPLIITAAVVLGLLFVADAPRAEASSSFGIYFGTGPSISRGYGVSRGPGCFPTANPYRGHYHWHDTSHLHVQPGGFVPHGNHFHYVPSQHYWHQDGHFDLHRGNRIYHHR